MRLDIYCVITCISEKEDEILKANKQTDKQKIRAPAYESHHLGAAGCMDLKVVKKKIKLAICLELV